MATALDADLFIEDELKRLKAGNGVKDCPEAQLVTCQRALVRFEIRLTDFKRVAVNVQFPVGYPEEEPVVVELKSKTISDRFLANLGKVCDAHLKELAGKRQIARAIQFIVQFLRDNPFVVCPDELAFVKKTLFREGDEIKVKKKTGSISYKAVEGRYFTSFQLTIPDHYPSAQVVITLKESNFPSEFDQVTTGLSVEMARKCVEPPAMKKKGQPPFVPTPSLQKVADFIVTDCVRRYPKEACPLCNERALPSNPSNLMTDEKHPKFVVRVYCGHLYHCGCLDTYMKTPPFQGGKKCLVCGERIFHDRWRTSARVLEERWSHQQAKKREVEEMADFLRL